jgi:hypothetical protein
MPAQMQKVAQIGIFIPMIKIRKFHQHYPGALIDSPAVNKTPTEELSSSTKPEVLLTKKHWVARGKSNE